MVSDSASSRCQGEEKWASWVFPLTIPKGKPLGVYEFGVVWALYTDIGSVRQHKIVKPPQQVSLRGQFLAIVGHMHTKSGMHIYNHSRKNWLLVNHEFCSENWSCTEVPFLSPLYWSTTRSLCECSPKLHWLFTLQTNICSISPPPTFLPLWLAKLLSPTEYLRFRYKWRVPRIYSERKLV